NPFNVLVPFYANVTTTPAYLADTTTHVTTENFYLANRIVGALADADFGASLPHVERYQERVGGLARAIIHETDRAIRDADMDCVAAHVPLEEANHRIAALLRTETDELLDHVLYEASMRMHNAFSRSDK
ncbi:MAG: C69 family dipeptidase, partial [Olsenella sp.]